VTGSSSRSVSWRPQRPAELLGAHDGATTGYLDETARRLSHEEYAVAKCLAAEGHAVRSLATSRDGTRRADLEVCGQRVEIKSWLSLTERDGRPPTARSVVNKLIDASEQADICVLYGRRSSLTEAAVREGIGLYAARRAGPGGLRAVRAIGDGFDLGWDRPLDRGLTRPPVRLPRLTSEPATPVPVLGM
jgi:hypothetical protein